MKKALFIAALFLGICSTNSVTAQIEYDPDNLSITITNETSRADLWQMRQDLINVGIDFKYSPDFDNNRKLTAIKVDIVTDDGDTGSFQTSLLNNEQKVEIIRNISENGAVNFCVGQDCSGSAD